MSFATEQSVLNAQYNAAVCAQQAESERIRPSVLYRPALSLDGDQWCALYGADLMNGVAGFGASPAEAMADFDAAWTKKLPTGSQQ